MKIRIACAALGIGAMVALAGCAEQPASPSGTESTTVPVVDAPAADPASRVPLTCDELAGESDITTALGEPMGPVSVLDYVPDLTPFVTVQYGQLDCEWSPDARHVNYMPSLVTISVIPDVPVRYWTETVAMWAGTGAAAGGFAGDSYIRCAPETAPGWCHLDTLVNGYWVSVSAYTEEGVTLENATPLFTAAVAAVGSAGGAGERWAGPSDDDPAPHLGVIDAAEYAAALGASVTTKTCGPTAQTEEHWVAQAETGFLSCVFSVEGLPSGEAAYVSVNYLPGGAWALDDARATLDGYTTDVPELRAGAFSTPEMPGSSTIFFTRGSDLVSVLSTPSLTEELSDETLTMLAKALVPALP